MRARMVCTFAFASIVIACGGGKGGSVDAAIDAGLDDDAPPPDACVPRTCDLPTIACNDVDDGCGGTLDCTCPGELTCGAVEAGICGVTQADRVCTNGWCWEHPLPFGMNLSAVWGATTDDVWAAGSDGTLLRFEGSKWRIQASGTTDDFTSLWGTAANNIYSTNRDRLLRRWNGASWATVPGAPTDIYLNVVRGSSANDIWIAGDFGQFELSHWNGMTWQGAAKAPEAFFGVSALLVLSPQFAWAFGFSDTHMNWTGSAWVDLPGAPQGTKGLFGKAQNDIWAGGSSGLQHWNGSVWTDGPDELAIVNALEGTSASDIWAGGFGGLQHFDGTTWSAPYVTANEITAISPALGATTWAVGSSGGTFRHDGAAWSQRTGFGPRYDFQRGFRVSDDELWIFGYGRALRWKAGVTTDIPMPSNGAPIGVWIPEPGFLSVASRSGEISTWNGTAWKTSPPQTPDKPFWNAVITLPGSTDLYVVTDAAQAFELSDAYVLKFDGVTWSVLTTIKEPGPLDFGNDLVAIGGTSPTNLWVTGEEGIVYRYDGATWTKQQTTPAFEQFYLSPTGTLFGVLGDVYKLGGNGTWTRVGAGPTLNMQTISGSSDNDLCGTQFDSSAVHCWNGQTWTTQQTHAGQNIVDVIPTPSAIFAIGSGNGLLRKAR